MHGFKIMFNGNGGIREDWGGGGGDDSVTNNGEDGEWVTEEGYGPFNAKVWTYLGSEDPIGLPKLQAWKTVGVNGKNGIAFKCQGNWKIFQCDHPTTFWSRLRIIYRPSQLIGF